MKRPIFEMTPRQIVRELNQYVVGQHDAKRAVAIALRNRWRRRQVEDEMRGEILPNNILMIGPTGVGKTEIARRLARLAGAPFVKVEASKFTEVGYVGRDVEGIVRDLVDVAVSQVRREKTIEVEKIAAERVEERILDLLLPPPPSKKKHGPIRTALSDILNVMEAEQKVTVTDIETEETDEEEIVLSEEELKAIAEKEKEADERYLRSREKLRKQLIEGRLADAEVEITLSEQGGGAMLQVFGPMGMEEMGINLQEMLGSMMPQKRKTRSVTVSEAQNLLISEEIDKLLDMDEIIEEALLRTEEMGIVFLDEIDKISGPEEGGAGPDVSREGVQRDILPIVEGTRVSTKYGHVNTDHILFIAAGAFHVARPSDLIPELQGRFPIRVELDSLTRKEFVKILTQPKNALVKQYSALLETEKVALTFEKPALSAIAELAEQFNETGENIGARRLHTVMTTLLEDILFDVPSSKIKEVVVTKAMVHERLDDLLEDEDLSRYIL